MNEQSVPRTSIEYEKSLCVNPNTRVPKWLAGDKVTRENTDVIKKVGTYQNFITETKPEMSRNTIGRESGKKNQIITKMKIARRNAIIS